MAFDPENDLEQLLARAANDVSAREEFLRALLDGEVIVALFGETPDADLVDRATGMVRQGQKLTMRAVERDGIAYLPIFTAASRAAAWARANHIAAPERTRDLFRRHPATHFTLNPGADCGKDFTPGEISRLLAGEFADVTTRVVDKPTQVLVGSPAVFPHAFAVALAKRLPDLPMVSQALFGAMSSGAERPVLLLEIVADAADDATRTRIGALLRETRPEDLVFDLHLVTRPGDLLCGGVAQPFYTRPEGGSAPEKPARGVLGRLFSRK
jgi:hypothetical protein